MRIYNQIGSKERLVEIFQKVNKVKLNENLLEMGGSNLNPQNVLNMAFNQLLSNKLKIKHSNTQANGNESFVELMCLDNQGNNITFTFKATTSEGDQDGVYNLNQAALETFSFDTTDGEESVDLAQDALKQFNAQHANELLDIVEKYVDVEPQGVESAENSNELAEAIKLIDAIKKDSYPFGGGTDRLQTGKAYGDEKPTNPAVRVKAPELDKFVQENLAPVGGKITDLKTLGRKLTKEDIPNLSKDVLYKVAMSLANKMLPLSWDDFADVNSMWDYIREGMTFDQLKVNVKKAVNKRLKEEGYSLKDLGLGETINEPKPIQEFDKPSMKLKMQPMAGPTNVEENEYDDDTDSAGYGQGIDTAEINPDDAEYPEPPEEVPTIDDTLPVDKEPAPEVSPEKRDKIFAAYNNLIKNSRNPNYTPTTPEVMAELDRMAGVVKPRNTRAIPKGLESFSSLWEEENKDEKDYPDPLGKKFKPKRQFPKKKRKPQTTVKLDEDINGDNEIAEIYWEKYPYYLMKAGDSTHFYMSNNKKALLNGDVMVSHIGEHNGRPYYNDVRSWLKGGESPNGKDYDTGNNMQTSYAGPSIRANESTDRDKYEEVVFLQGDEAYQPLEILDREGADAALEYLKQWHYPGEHQGSQKLGHGTEDKVYEKDGYIMSWNPRLDYIGLQYDMAGLNEDTYEDDDISNLPEVPKGYGEKGIANRDMSKEFSGVAKPVEEPVEFAEGDEMSQLEKDNPDLYPLGWKQMDGMFMGPSSRGFGQGKTVSVPQGEMNGENDEEMTNLLLGFKPHNVGDEFEGDENITTPFTSDGNKCPEIGPETEEVPEEEKTIGEDLGYSENDLKQRDPATWHQIQIAKKTMKMPGAMAGVMGGMSKEEAAKILKQRGIKISEVILPNGSSSENQSNSQDAFKKYQEYQKKDLNTLPDDQKEEFFELWKLYKDKK